MTPMLAGVVGHENTRMQLAGPMLPPVSLLRGPRSIGKWRLAQAALEHHRILPADQLLVDKLTVADTHRIHNFARTGAFGRFKGVCIRLDNADVRAETALLKLLEEPPATTWFILTASHPPLPTIESRAAVFRLGMLTRAEVALILQVVHGFSPTVARRAADATEGGAFTALGQVASALQAAGAKTAGAKTAAAGRTAGRTTALALLQALGARDPALFDKAAAEVDAATQEHLHRFLVEAVTGQWREFTPADGAGLHTDRARLYAILGALHEVGKAHSRLAVRAALEPYLTH